MKISVNDQELYTLSEIEKRIIADTINVDELDGDLRRRLHWLIGHKVDQCFIDLKKRWGDILASRYEVIPTGREELAALIFAQPDYKDRKTRDLEALR